MKKLLRVAAVAVTGLSFAAPAAFASAQTGTTSTTGPNSPVTVHARDNNDVRVRHQNRLNLHNDSTQTAKTGNASVGNNTTVGGVGSGGAMNDNMTDAAVGISTSSSSTAAASTGGAGGSNWGTATTQGPNSPVHVDVKSNNSHSVETKNDIMLHNNSTQAATSGSASAHNNTTVGDVTTGDAHNTNSSIFTVEVTSM
jgi:hypothetical protein